MLTLGIEFLTGRYVATAYNDRRRAEWPPHPARVFSALVATHFEDPERDPSERDALLWLERQAPPEIHGTDARIREVVDVFVPVNDPSVIGNLWREYLECDEARAAVDVADTTGASDKVKASARRELAKAEAKLASKVAKAIAPADGPLAAETKKQGLALLPEQRGKQPRTFPSVVPDQPRVALVWRDAQPDDGLRAALDRLAARVVRLGHSSSFVSMRVVERPDPSTPAYRVPDPDGDEVLRGVESGQFDRLCDDFTRHQGTEPRVMPAAVHLYAPQRQEAVERLVSVFSDEWIVLEFVDGPLLSMTRVVDVARAVRNALQKFSPEQPAPEIISGHRAPGLPSDRPHLAIVPLPFVGHRRADGILRGVALVLPRAAKVAERKAVLRAVGAWALSEKARDGDVAIHLSGGLEVMGRRTAISTLSTLHAGHWCRPSIQWATATPIALDRHPGDLRSLDPRVAAEAIVAAETTIVAACRHIGLPEPLVELQPAAPIAGARKAREYAAYPPVAGRARRALTHAVLTFAEPVAGPVLLGAARYHGLGLLLPCDGDPR